MPGEIRHKEFRFPVHVVWHAGRRTTARVDGKAPLADRHAAGVPRHRP